MSYETEHPYQNYDPNFNPDEVMMRLHQLQNRIASTISAVEREDGVIKEKQSQIEQTVDEISLEVFEIDSTTGTKISRIEQNAEEISSKVAKIDYNGNTIASLINQTATTIKIAAEKVNITGFVTFSALSTEGETTIHGGNIMTGTIVASDIYGNLFSVGNGVTTSRLDMFTSDDNYHYIMSNRAGTTINGGLRIVVPNGPLSLVSHSGTGVYVTDSPLVAQVGIRVTGTGQFNNNIDVAGTATINTLNVTSYNTQRINGATLFDSYIDVASTIYGFSATLDGACDAGAMSSYGYFRYAGNTSNYFRVGAGSAHVYVNGQSKASWASLPKVSIEPSGDGILDGNEFGVNNGGSMQPTLTDFFRNVEVDGEKEVALDSNFLKFVGDYDIFFAAGGNVSLKEKRAESFILEGQGVVSLFVMGIQKGKENIVGYEFVEFIDEFDQTMRDFGERRIDR